MRVSVLGVGGVDRKEEGEGEGGPTERLLFQDDTSGANKACRMGAAVVAVHVCTLWLYCVCTARPHVPDPKGGKRVS